MSLRPPQSFGILSWLFDFVAICPFGYVLGGNELQFKVMGGRIIRQNSSTSVRQGMDNSHREE
jgi:hypothetical protein